MDSPSSPQKDLLLSITFFAGIAIAVINATLVIPWMKEITNLNLAITGAKVGAIVVILTVVIIWSIQWILEYSFYIDIFSWLVTALIIGTIVTLIIEDRIGTIVAAGFTFGILVMTVSLTLLGYVTMGILSIGFYPRCAIWVISLEAIRVFMTALAVKLIIIIFFYGIDIKNIKPYLLW
jgi:predicted neutral ceramidase superfamily lipid hydrolase